MSEKENSSSASQDEARKGLSKEAWVAISTIAAALITGIVTLIIHLAPQRPSTSAPTATPTTNVSSPVTSVGITADSIAGKWSGKAVESNGESFYVTLDVRKSCGINERCGSMSVSHVPCYGEIFLERAHDPVFEFRVDNFYGQSNLQKCSAGAGEVFQLRPDGRLDYRPTYDPLASAVLERTHD